MLFFPAQAEYSYFSAHFRLKIFLYYSSIIAYDISVLEFIGVYTVCICITCTVHRTVISVEHFAIASAGFFRFVG